jgi:cytochrome c5
MRHKYLLIWLTTIAALMLAGCSASPTQTTMEPTVAVPLSTVVEATLAPTDVPAAKPPETVEPAFTVVVPTNEPTTSVQASTGQGDQIMQAVCTVCHSSDRILNSHKTQAEWQITVDRMISYGAVLTDSEKQIMIKYLSETYKR